MNELNFDMALRTFTDRDGDAWNVWNVVAAGKMSGYQERFREGWICFERVAGGGRCRLPLSEVPPGWESLPDDRLDLIRRVAATATTTGAVARLSDEERARIENEAKIRRSGPRQVIGFDDELTP